jgi:hypothetical protein
MTKGRKFLFLSSAFLVLVLVGGGLIFFGNSFFQPKNSPYNAEELVKRHIQVFVPGTPHLFCSGLILDPLKFLINHHSLSGVLDLSHNRIKVRKKDQSCDLALIEACAEDLSQKEKPGRKVAFASSVRVSETVYSINPETKDFWTMGNVVAITDDLIYAIGLRVKKGFSGSGIYNRQGKLVGVLSSELTIRDTDPEKPGPEIAIEILTPYWKIIKFLEEPD